MTSACCRGLLVLNLRVWKRCGVIAVGLESQSPFKNCGPLWSSAVSLFFQVHSYASFLLQEISGQRLQGMQHPRPAGLPCCYIHEYTTLGGSWCRSLKQECPDMWHRLRPSCGPTLLNIQVCQLQPLLSLEISTSIVVNQECDVISYNQSSRKPQGSLSYT